MADIACPPRRGRASPRKSCYADRMNNMRAITTRAIIAASVALCAIVAVPDLTVAAPDCNLRRNLVRADLSGCDLSRANLSGADLSGAYLYRANLTGATMAGANLSGANLTGANLTDHRLPIERKAEA